MLTDEPDDYMKHVKMRAKAEKAAKTDSRAHENITSQARTLLMRMEDQTEGAVDADAGLAVGTEEAQLDADAEAKRIL